MNFSPSLERFYKVKNKIISKNSRIGLLTNQCSYSFLYKKYSFELFEPEVVFLLEHGFFSEFQDQISIQDEANYKKIYHTNWISLYGKDFGSLYPKKENLKNLDWIIIDIQDIGSRYYTFLTSVYFLLETIIKEKLECNIILLDRPNPLIKNYSKRKFEGSPLQKKYESFVGVSEILHKHGLTSGELLFYYVERLFNKNLKNQIWVVPFDSNLPIFKIFPEKNQLMLKEKINSILPEDFEIYPSPNMPSFKTARVYTGQCLLEGTNLSEGRGTTKPFEIFGAPFLEFEVISKISELSLLKKMGVILRKLKFIPTSNKYHNQVCNGWQLHILKEDKYHSLFTTIAILKEIKKICKDFDWYRGIYEFKRDFLAIEYLLGDNFLFEFLEFNKFSFDELYEYLRKHQNLWKKKIKKYLIYK